MTKKYALGIDMGTSSMKLLLLGQEGVLTQTSVPYDFSQTEAGEREIEPAVWERAAETGIRELLYMAPEAKAHIVSIGVTGQMHTTVLLDEEGRSIRPALMWNDTRTSDLLDEIRERLGEGPKVLSARQIISTGSPAVNLYWLKEKEPESFRRLQKFLIGPDYLVYWLTGALGTDYCEASTSALYDFERGSWSGAIREALGLPEKIFPPIHGAGEVVGHVKASLAESLGLGQETRVIAGTGDNPASVLAGGAGLSGSALLSLGTSGVLVFSRESADFSLKGKNIAFSLDGRERTLLVQGVLQSAGRDVDWWVKNILRAESPAAELADLGEVRPGDALFYPHLYGDKTLYADSSLTGAFLGLSGSTDRRELTRAVLEGLSFGVRELAERMGVPRESLSPLYVTGGGAKNRAWLQMLADILASPVSPLTGGRGAAYGIALLALTGKGESKPGRGEIFSPRADRSALYAGRYRRYLRIHDALAGL